MLPLEHCGELEEEEYRMHGTIPCQLAANVPIQE